MEPGGERVRSLPLSRASSSQGQAFELCAAIPRHGLIHSEGSLKDPSLLFLAVWLGHQRKAKTKIKASWRSDEPSVITEGD